jgi:hypothetical protein
MKKATIACIVLAFIIGCRTTPATNPDEVSLNTAIQQAAALMETRLDRGTKIALINFTSPSAAFSEYVLDELSSVLVNDGVLVVVDRASLDKVRQELDFNMSGEVSDQSAQAIGKMLGAEAIVTGSLTSIGDLRRVMFKVILTETAAVAVQHTADIINDKRIQALLASGGSQTSAYSGNTGRTAGNSGTPGTAITTPATPQNGTYTFWPRPQAKRAGIPADAYLVKIIVDGKYMLIYLTSVDRGMAGRADPGTWYGPANPLLTDLDNPSKTWELAAHRDDPDGRNSGEVLSFEDVTATRFSLECNWYVPFIFEEITLNDPDK